MRKFIIPAILLFSLSALTTISAFAAGITIGTGASMTLSGAPTVTTVDMNNSGSLTGGSGTISLKGDWTSTGTFTPGTGTIAIIGTGTSAINGSNTFYKFTCATASKSITFIADTTQVISNTLTITGSTGARITLRSGSSGTNWKINPQGTRSISFVDVQDSNNTNVTVIAPSDSVDAGNNTGWRFGALAFTSAAKTVFINTESSAFTFQINYENNNSANRNITVNLASGSAGTYRFRAVSGGASVTAVTIPAGSNNSQFYYIDNTVGTPLITISATGYNSAQQTVTIINVGYTVTAATPQIAGSNFTLTIKAIDQDGNVYTAYTGTANLTVNYIAPSTGAGTLGVTSTSTFTEGVATINNETFSDCGTITITATDSLHAGIKGTSANINFRPFDFTVVATGLDTASTSSAAGVQVVNKPFTLTITARNAQEATCPNYTGTAALSINYVSPSANQSGALGVSSLDSTLWTNGVASLTNETYNLWGKVTITAKDGTLTTQTGISSNIQFIPKNLSVTVSPPPPARAFYYSKENFSSTVKVNDFNGSAIPNYQGTISFTGSGLSAPANYTFATADSGSHIFTGISGITDTVMTTTLSSTDTTFSSVTGISLSITIKFATIQVVSTTGPVGSIVTQVQIVDSNGNIITEDNTTKFTVTITQTMPSGGVSSPATVQEVTVTGGIATIVVTDEQAETITITAESNPLLVPIPGTIRFGTTSGGGVGIMSWREMRGSAASEAEEAR